MHSQPIKMLMLFSALLISACASDKPQPVKVIKPLSGDQILRESQGMAQLGQKFNDGERMVQEGESLVSQGNQLISDGQKKITEGKRIMQETEQGYGEIKKQ